MKNILLIHGPNLNKLGNRNPDYYGNFTIYDVKQALELMISEKTENNIFNLISYQSNHEGNLIDFIQQESGNAVGAIINLGAFSHYSYALLDALLDSKLPVVEVHISDIKNREEWRQKSVTAEACISMISGKGIIGYQEALNILFGSIKNAS